MDTSLHVKRKVAVTVAAVILGIVGALYGASLADSSGEQGMISARMGFDAPPP
jgi:uncharacterized membrane protein YeaQ/YmgE (transglycosylase-associated protein family)